MSKMTETQALRLGMMAGYMSRVQDALRRSMQVARKSGEQPEVDSFHIQELEEALGGMMFALDALFETKMIAKENVLLGAETEQRRLSSIGKPVN